MDKIELDHWSTGLNIRSSYAAPCITIIQMPYGQPKWPASVKVEIASEVPVAFKYPVKCSSMLTYFSAFPLARPSPEPPINDAGELVVTYQDNMGCCRKVPQLEPELDAWLNRLQF